MERGRGPLRLLLPAVTVGLIALAGTGCGAGEEATTAAEGRDVTIGGVDYRVQSARILNPANPDDRSYLAGEPDAPGGSAYLAVFVQARNESDRTVEPTGDFTVIDTLGKRYKPQAIDNEFAYRAEPLAPGEQLPELDSAAETGPTAGGELLFLIKLTSTENDPLELEIDPEGGENGKITLDI